MVIDLPRLVVSHEERFDLCLCSGEEELKRTEIVVWRVVHQDKLVCSTSVGLVKVKVKDSPSGLVLRN